MFIQFVDVYNDLLHAHDNTKSLDIVYLDFQKEFDKVPHSKLMVKVKQLGINGKVNHCIKNWLSNRKQRVVINGAGSVLGSVLFIIYK